MEDTKTTLHTFRFEGSELKVPVRLDEPTGRYFLDCPDLEETPIYTSSGYPWVSVVQDSCPYHENRLPNSGGYTDCGTCRFFRGEVPRDIIGVCLCETLRKNGTSDTQNLGGTT
ncbi:MAG: hypothetical protein RR450_07945 [Oscillospiraceae bacterium]